MKHRKEETKNNTKHIVCFTKWRRDENETSTRDEEKKVREKKKTVCLQ